MPEAAVLAAGPDRTGPRVALVAAFLASAGLPLYIHLPGFAAELGLPLATIGALLLAIRVFDCVQDPALGLLAERWRDRRGMLAALSLAALGLGMAAIFLGQPGLAGLTGAMVLVFTAYSLGTILFYSQGVALAGGEGSAGHYRLAGWRETGTLAGILAAAILPAAVGAEYGPRAGYAALGAAAVLVLPAVLFFGAPIWTVAGPAPDRLRLADLLTAGAGRLILLALVNALPVAVTSTLFLFFVNDRLGLPDLAGPFLALFFLAAGLTAPLWSRLAARHGARRVLLPAMAVSVLAFAGTAALPEGAALAFAAITLASGAALGADMVILPALFARRLERDRLPAALGFGAWAFAAKLALALAAGTVLPALQLAGFRPGGPNDAAALSALNAAYAILPLILKLPAIWMVARLSDEAA